MEPVSAAVKVPSRIKHKYLEAAQELVPNPELLVNLVRLRVRQLAAGYRPITQTDSLMEFSDIALKEIGEGKLGYEFPLELEAAAAIAASPVTADTLAA